MLNPDSDTPDSETSTPTPRNSDRPRRLSDYERPSVRRELSRQQGIKTSSLCQFLIFRRQFLLRLSCRHYHQQGRPLAMSPRCGVYTLTPSANDLKVPMSQVHISSPVSPDFPPTSARLAPRYPEQQASFGPPPIRYEYSAPKLQAPPPPRARSPGVPKTTSVT